MAYKVQGYLVRCVWSEDKKYHLKYFGIGEDKRYRLSATKSLNAYTFKDYDSAYKLAHNANEAFNGKAHFAVSVLMDDWSVADREVKMKDQKKREDE